MRDFLSRVKRPCHLVVRISGSHPENMGSIPIRAAKFKLEQTVAPISLLFFQDDRILQL